MSEVATKTSPTPDSPAGVTHTPTCPTLHPPTRTANQHMHPLITQSSRSSPASALSSCCSSHVPQIQITLAHFVPPAQSPPSFVSPFPLALQPSVQQCHQVLSVSLFHRPSSGNKRSLLMVTTNILLDCSIALLNDVPPTALLTDVHCGNLAFHFHCLGGIQVSRGDQTPKKGKGSKPT